MEYLKKIRGIRAISGDGPSVLTDLEYMALQDMQFSNESQLIKHLTPTLQKIVCDAASKSGYALVLVNSERQAWVEDPNGGEASKPDMIVLHSALYTRYKTSVDRELDGPGFNFGHLANFDLCDSISATLEWRVNIGDNHHAAFGQGLDYVRRMGDFDFSGVHHEDDVVEQRLMVADKKGFALSEVWRGRAISYRHGSWSSPGSRDAICDFFTMKRLWLDALNASCSELKVTPILPSCDSGSSSFLGRGAQGRVFLVRRLESGEADAGATPPTPLALKISIGSAGCNFLIAEAKRYEEMARKFASASPSITTTLEGSYVDVDMRYASLLLSPVGTRLGPPFTMYQIRAALISLRQLSVQGVYHGDARWPNVIWVGDGSSGSAIWADFQTSVILTSVSADRFAADVRTFWKSFHQNEGVDIGSDFRLAAQTFLADEGSIKPLLHFFQSVWQGGQ